MIAHAIFWTSCILLGYTLVGYPLAITLWARVWPRRTQKGNETPSTTVIVVAHNEAARIGARIENLLALDYPAEQLNIMVCSDGSSDATVTQARGYQGRVTVFAFEEQRGKPAVLNEIVPRASSEIVVFADARQRFEPVALRQLVAPFADPAVGTVSGDLYFEASPAASAVGTGVGSYWHYEKLIRRSESLVDSTIGATGAIYAIRRQLFEPIPADTLLDDVLIPMAGVRRGYRTLFEPTARAYDQVAQTGAQEFARKVRTIAGNFQLFARHRWLFDPRHNRLWLQTLSHKFLRLLGPLFLVGALVANLFMLHTPFFHVTLALQVVFYAAALTEHLLAHLPRRRSRGRLLRILLGVPYAFCVLQAATVVGFLRFVGGRQRVTWKKAAV